MLTPQAGLREVSLAHASLKEKRVEPGFIMLTPQAGVTGG